MDYLSGELPAEVRSAFDHHLTLCPNCVNYLASYKATVEMGRRAFDDPDTVEAMPEDLVKAILAARSRGSA
jgi:anti-sigma factor RsiW